MGDGELIDAVLAGDRDRFRPLMERYQQPIFAYLYRLLYADRDAAQDVTQSVFLKAYQGLATVDRTRPFANWLYRIAHNEAANHLRGRMRRREAHLDDAGWAHLPDPGADSPEATHAAAEERARMRAALAALKPIYRQVVTLYYFEDRSYEDIAEIAGIAPGTVAARLHRARKRLETLLAEPATRIRAPAGG